MVKFEKWINLDFDKALYKKKLIEERKVSKPTFLKQIFGCTSASTRVFILCQNTFPVDGTKCYISLPLSEVVSLWDFYNRHWKWFITRQWSPKREAQRRKRLSSDEESVSSLRIEVSHRYSANWQEKTTHYFCSTMFLGIAWTAVTNRWTRFISFILICLSSWVSLYLTNSQWLVFSWNDLKEEGERKFPTGSFSLLKKKILLLWFLFLSKHSQGHIFKTIPIQFPISSI